MAPQLLAGLRRIFVIADKAYDSDAVRQQLRDQKCTAVIPSRSNRRRKSRLNKPLYRRRHLVENFFQRIKRYRRIAMRFEKRAENFLSMLCLAAALTWLL